MFRLAVKKIINNKVLMLSLFAGILAAVTIACTIPMYSQSISHRMLVTQLENYQEASGISPSSVVISCSLSAFTRSDEESTNFTNFNYCNNYLNDDLFVNIGMPPIVKSTTLACATMYAADSRDQKGSTFNQIVLKATDSYENAIKIIDGRMPGDTLDSDGCVEVIVSRANHINNKYTVGTTYELAYSSYDLDVNSNKELLLKVKVVGIFDYLENSKSTIIDKDKGNEFYSDYNMYYNYIFKEKDLCSSATWYYAGDFTQYDLNRINDTINAVKRLENKIILWGLSGSAKITVPPIEQYMTYYDNVNSVNVLLILYYSPVLILMVVFIFMISRFVVENDKNEISMLKSRGSSRKQIVLLYLLQGGAIVLVSIILAPLLSYILCNLMGTTSGFLEFLQRAPLKVGIPANSIAFCFTAAVLALLTMLIPVYKVSKVDIVVQKRKNRNRVLEYIFLAAGAVITGIVAGYSYYNLVYQQEGLFTSSGGVQPLAYVFLICFYACVTFIFVLVYPLIINIFFNINRQKLRPVKYYTLSRMKNPEIKEKFIIIFLTLTIAIGAFSSVCARTLNLNMDNSTAYKYPCDIIADVTYYANDNDEKINRRFLFNDVEGIEATRIVTGNQPRITTKIGKSIYENVSMYAINPQKFGEIVQWNDNILPNPLSYYLNKLEADANTCIISENVAQVLGVEEGNVIYLKPDLSLKGNVVLSVTVTDIVKAWPTYTNKTVNSLNIKEENYLIVLNIKAVDAIAPNQPYSVWMNTDMSVSELKSLTVKLAATAEKYEDRVSARLTNITNGARERYLGQINPLRQATNGSLTLGFTAVIFICAIGFIIYWIISIKSRTLQIGTMRALGMSFRDIYEMVLWEQFLICFASIIVGIISGIASGILFAPLLQSAFGSMGEMPPYQVAFEFADIIKLVILILSLISVSIAAGIIILKHIKATTAIKLGEE